MKNSALLFSFFIFFYITLNSQHITLKFCGKNTEVIPTIDPNTGQDQRFKGAITLDHIKLGTIGNSKCCPFHALGIPSVKPSTFATKIFVDNCPAVNGSGSCTGCSICNVITYGNNIRVGAMEGRMQNNVKVEGKIDNLLIQSTGDQNVVCFVTDRIDVSPYKGKIIEVTIAYSGNITGNFTTRNINFSYIYNTDPWPSTPYFFNKNSNNTGSYVETYALLKSVPTVAVENLDAYILFEINPNPVKEQLILNYHVEQSFKGVVQIIDEIGKVLFNDYKEFDLGKNHLNIDVQNIPNGIYTLTISDASGRASVSKFVK